MVVFNVGIFIIIIGSLLTFGVVFLKYGRFKYYLVTVLLLGFAFIICLLFAWSSIGTEDYGYYCRVLLS
jgi:predicted membrane channel-forming protein YqfA (hemolysin III family)